VRLFVVRHGEAGTALEDERLGADLKRPLDPDGRAHVEALGQWMKDNDSVPTVIYHSPAARTRQTAQILGKITGAKLKADDTLQWGNSIRGVVKKVAADPKKKRVCIVSHHDCIRTGLRALNYVNGGRVDPIAKAEMRELKIDRDAAAGKTQDPVWEETNRVLPSDIDRSFDDQYL
jgi:phosphohistidine phosphatase SixA